MSSLDGRYDLSEKVLTHAIYQDYHRIPNTDLCVVDQLELIALYTPQNLRLKKVNA